MTTGVASMAVLPMALLGVVGAIAIPAAQAADVQTTASPYAGYSTGSVVYANAVNLGNPDVAKASTAQSAAGVAENGRTLTTTDQLLQPLSVKKSTTGKSSYGQGAGANIGLLQNQTAAAQIAPIIANAVAPAPSKDTGQELLSLPLAPLAEAHVLPGNAAANTTADHACPAVGTPLSEGDAHAANAKVLDAGAGTVVGTVNATDDTASQTSLANPTTATGTPIAGDGKALASETSENLAPIILFAGTPLQIEVDVLKPLVLRAVAGGVPGSAHVTYGVPGLSGSDPVITVKFPGGTTQTITTADLLGGTGLQIGLGVADVTVGAPAHSLTGLEGSAVTATADGTQASAAVDVVRVTVPGKLAAGVTAGGPLLGQLQSGLNSLVQGLGAVTGPIGTALNQAGLGVADIRYGHFEAQAGVPTGGIICKSPNHPAPFDESYKDTSSKTVAAGKTFSYTVRFPNRGDLPVNNVKVVDTFTGGPPPLQFISSVPAPASQSGNTLTYSFGTLQPGQYAQVTLTFKVPADAKPGTLYHNSATITGTYNGAPVTKTVHVDAPTVLPLGPAGCNLSYSTKYASNKKVTTGENFAYYIDVLNAGSTTCTDVTVKDTLTSGVTFVSCTMGCTHSGQNISWSIGDLEPGASKVLQVVVHTTARSGTLPNTADLASTNGGTGSPHTPGPAVSTVSVGNPGNPAACPTTVCKVQPARQLAFTGGLGPTTIALALLGSSGLLLMARRRRAYDI